MYRAFFAANLRCVVVCETQLVYIYDGACPKKKNEENLLDVGQWCFLVNDHDGNY